MKIQKQAAQLTLLHTLMDSKRTGPPDRLSGILGISKSKLYEVLEELKACGATIAYSRKRETFYYKNHFVVDVRCIIRPLHPDEADRLSGGCASVRCPAHSIIHCLGASRLKMT